MRSWTVTLHAEHSREQSPDVWIEKAESFLKSENQDRARGVAAYAGKRQQLRFTIRHTTAELVNEHRKCRPQILRPRRPSEGQQHAAQFTFRCLRRGISARELAEERAVYRRNLRRACSLEHELGYEDAVRIARLTPRIVTPVA
jgi:hypothetical protein